MPVQCSGAVPDEDLICAIVEFTLPTAPTRPGGVSSIVRMLIKSGPKLRRSLEFAKVRQGRQRRHRPAAHRIVGGVARPRRRLHRHRPARRRHPVRGRRPPASRHHRDHQHVLRPQPGPSRAKLRIDFDVFLTERIDLLWTAWTDANPGETARILERD